MGETPMLREKSTFVIGDERSLASRDDTVAFRAQVPLQISDPAGVFRVQLAVSL